MAHYIDKDALVAEIEKLRAKNKVSIFDKIPFKPNYEIGQKTGAYGTLGLLLDTIDTLEVKDVDLEKELDLWMEYNQDDAGYFNTLKLVEYFFELGLKVQKG